jgi:N-acetylmuramoyl-L-alanine amidase
MNDLEIVQDLLPYHERLEERDLSRVEMIVLHCTELPTLEMAREYGERITLPESQTGFSGHYYVNRDARVYQYVPDHRMARHVIGYNERSIGIEIVNLGRYPNWFHSRHQNSSEPYSKVQIEAVRSLLQRLKARYPQIEKLVRHSDLDLSMISAEDDPSVQIRRKIDPGPMFPWDEFSRWWTELNRSFSSEQRF